MRATVAPRFSQDDSSRSAATLALSGFITSTTVRCITVPSRIISMVNLKAALGLLIFPKGDHLSNRKGPLMFHDRPVQITARDHETRRRAWLPGVGWCSELNLRKAKWTGTPRLRVLGGGGQGAMPPVQQTKSGPGCLFPSPSMRREKRGKIHHLGGRCTHVGGLIRLPA
jgi:hypothetical protein